MNKKSYKSEAQIRTLFDIQIRAQEDNEQSYIVEGYAAKFEPYVLYEDEAGPVYEEFKKGCFDECDMSDIIMQYDHAGHVLARTRNNSLSVFVDDIGLKIQANLSMTEKSREMYEEIVKGLVDRMSWRFRIGSYYYDKESRTIIHESVKKIYDVSAVSIPANDNTEINARSFADGVISERARRDAEHNDKIKRLQLRIKIKGEINNDKN